MAHGDGGLSSLESTYALFALEVCLDPKRVGMCDTHEKGPFYIKFYQQMAISGHCR